jgi:hypothetical protein
VGWDSPLGASATNWPSLPAPYDRRWVRSSLWNENWQGKPKYLEKACPSTTFSTTNHTWTALSSNQGRRGGKSVTNRLSYGAAWVVTMSCKGTRCCVLSASTIVGRAHMASVSMLRSLFLPAKSSYSFPCQICNTPVRVTSPVSTGRTTPILFYVLLRFSENKWKLFLTNHINVLKTN